MKRVRKNLSKCEIAVLGWYVVLQVRARGSYFILVWLSKMQSQNLKQKLQSMLKLESLAQNFEKLARGSVSQFY